MNILKKKVSYSYEPNIQAFNNLISKIKKADKDKAILLMHKYTIQHLVIKDETLCLLKIKKKIKKRFALEKE